MTKTYFPPIQKHYFFVRVMIAVLGGIGACAVSSFAATQTDVPAVLDKDVPLAVQGAVDDRYLPEEMPSRGGKERDAAAPDGEAPLRVIRTSKELKRRPQGLNSDAAIKTEEIEAQANSYNQEAIHLFEAGRYEEAQEKWQKAIGVIEGIGIEGPAEFVEGFAGEEDSSADEKTIAEDDVLGPADGDKAHGEDGVVTEQDKQRQEAVKEIYEDAIQLYRNGDFDRAKERFEEVQWLLPGYRAGDKYIAQIENELEYENRMQPPQVQEEGEQGEELWEDVIEETEQLRRKELERKASKLYQQAVVYFQEKKYQEAQGKFEETEVFFPGYKDTPHYLAQIEQQIVAEQESIRQEELLLEKKQVEREESDFEKSARERELKILREAQEKASVLYEKAIQLYKRGQYQNARIKFEEVNLLCPDYKFTQRYLSRVGEDIAREEKNLLDQKQRQEALAGKKEMREWRRVVDEVDRGHEKKLKEEAERIYQQAREYHARGDLRGARLYFQEVGRTVPHYKSVDKFLTRIDEDLVKERRRRLERRYRWKMFIQKREQERSTAIQTAQKDREGDALRQRVEPLYLEAKNFYRQGHFKEAKKKFSEVAEQVPGYKSSAQFLSRLDADIRRQEQYQEKRTKRERARKERIRQFLKDQRNRNSHAMSQKEKENLGNTLAHIKEDRREKLAEKAQMLYDAGQAHYKERLLKVAQETFLEIERIIPDYKSTRKYLARIRSEIDREQRGGQQSHAVGQAVAVDHREEEPEADSPSDALTHLQQDFFQAIKSERLKRQGQEQEAHVKESEPGSKKQELVKTEDTEQEQKQSDQTETKGKKPDLIKKENTDVRWQRAVTKAYKEAMRYFDKKKFQSAELKVNEAEGGLADAAPEDPFSKEYMVKLQKLRERIQDAVARQQTPKGTLRPDDVAATAAGEDKPVKVQDPSVNETLRGIQGQQEQVRREREQAWKSFQRKLEEIYGEAVRSYKKGKLQEARALFLEIEKVSPDYKSTRDYLKKSSTATVPATTPQKTLSEKNVVKDKSVKPNADIVNKALDLLETGK